MKSVDEIKKGLKNREKDSSNTRDTNAVKADLLKSRFQKDASDLTNSYNDYITGNKKRYYDDNGKYVDNYRSDSEEWYKKSTKDYYDIQSKARNLKYNMSKYGKYYDDDFVSDIKSLTDKSFSDSDSVYDFEKKVYDNSKNFKNENEFNTYKKQYDIQSKFSGKSYRRIMNDYDSYSDEEKAYIDENKYNYMTVDELKAEKERLKQEKASRSSGSHVVDYAKDFVSNAYDKTVGYLSGNLDYRLTTADEYENSHNTQLVETALKNKELETVIPKLDNNTLALIDKYNEYDGRSFLAVAKDVLSNLGFSDNGEGNALNALKNVVNAETGKNYTEEEIEHLAELRDYQKGKEKSDKINDFIAENSNDVPVAISALTAGGLNLVGGVSGSADILYQTYEKLTGEREEINPYSSLLLPTRASTQIDTTVLENHNWNIGNIDMFDFGYELGRSIEDNLLRNVTSLGNPAIAGGLMSAEVFSQSVIDGKDKGYSDSKAITSSVLQSLIEGITEKYSLEVILDSKLAKNVFQAVAKSFAAEGSEEVVSNWLNRILDSIQNGQYSETSKNIAQRMLNGETEVSAITNALLDNLGEDFEALLLGGLSGALMGGGVYVGEAENSLKNKAVKGYLNQKETKAYKNSLVAGDEVTQKLAEGTDSYQAYKEAYDKYQSDNSKDNLKGLKKASKETAKNIKQNVDTKTKTTFNTVLYNELNSEGNTVTDDEYMSAQKWANGDMLTEYDRSNIENLGEEKVRGAIEKAYEQQREKAYEIKDNASSAVIEERENAYKDLLKEGAQIKTTKDKKGIVESVYLAVDDNTNNDVEVSPASKMYSDIKLLSELGSTDDTLNSINAVANESGADFNDLAIKNRMSILGQDVDLTSSVNYSNAEDYLKQTAKNRVVAQKTLETGLDISEVGKDVYKSISKKARLNLRFADKLSKVFGNKVVVFVSTLVEDENGKKTYVVPDNIAEKINVEKGEQSPYGAYSGKDGTIYLDLNGKGSQKDWYVYSLSHEYTHAIAQNASEKFEDLAAFVFKEMGYDNVERLIRKKQDTQHIDLATAREEVVADACEEMLLSDDFIDHFNNLYSENKGLAQKLLRMLKKTWLSLKTLVNSMDEAYLSEEAKLMRQSTNEAKKLFAQKYAEALKVASGNYQASETLGESKTSLQGRDFEEEIARYSLGDNYESVDNSKGELEIAYNNTDVMYSERTWETGGKDQMIQYLKDNGYSESDISDFVSAIDNRIEGLHALAEKYANLSFPQFLDHLNKDIVTDIRTGKRTIFSFVSNGDYPVNIDTMLNCKKRIQYGKVLSRLAKSGVLGKIRFQSEAIALVNKILAQNGFETACHACFVEARRQQLQAWAETIVIEYNERVDQVIKQYNKTHKDKLTEGYLFTDNGNAVSDDDLIYAIGKLSEEGKTEDGNVIMSKNEGGGSAKTVYDKAFNLISADPKIFAKKLKVSDLLTAEGIEQVKRFSPEIFSLVKSRYGAASPKIIQDFNAYQNEILDLSFTTISKMTGNSVKGNLDITRSVKQRFKKEFTEKAKEIVAKQYPEINNAKERKKMVTTVYNQMIARQSMREYLFSIGGARIQSFSDFMIENVLDYIQIFTDMTLQKLPMHGYTKEMACLRLFGMSGAKWNGSWIAHTEESLGKEMAGLLPYTEENAKHGITVEVDGTKYVIQFDDFERNQLAKKNKDLFPNGDFIQSIGYKDLVSLMLDPRYSANVGSITIGFSDLQIRAMLNSPLFRMVIPYHKSGMSPLFAHLMGVSKYNDYSDYQTTRVAGVRNAKTGEVYEYKKNKDGHFVIIDGKEHKISVDTSFAFDEDLQRTGDAKTTADNYLAFCKAPKTITVNGIEVEYTLHPEFNGVNEKGEQVGYDFTQEDNYYKLLENFNTYDSLQEITKGKKVPAPQGVVSMAYAGESKSTTLTESQLEQYRKDLESVGLYTEEEINKYVEKAKRNFTQIIEAELASRNAIAAELNPKEEFTYQTIENELLNNFSREGRMATNIADYLEGKEVVNKILGKNLTDKYSFNDRSKDANKISQLTPKGTYLQSRDDEYLELAKNPKKNASRLRSLVDEEAKRKGYQPEREVAHGTLNGGFNVFDRYYSHVGGNSGAGLYSTTNILDAEDNYSDVEGADNYFKASALADQIVDLGEYNGEPISDYDEALEIAKKEITKNPMVYHLYVKTDNPYYRDFGRSTNLYDDLIPENESDYGIDRNDYDSDEDYEDDLFNYKYEYIGNKLYDIVQESYYDLENNYEVIGNFNLNEIISDISEQAYEYESLSWNDLTDILDKYDIEVIRDDWSESAYASRELSRLIVEKFGYDSIIDNEVSKKFNQLKNMDAEDAQHIIAFFPHQFKLVDLVTYDDNGNIIPLSERFNENNEDIRYSTRDSEGNTLTEAQQEYFKDSKVRDENGNLLVVYHGTRNSFSIFSKDKRGSNTKTQISNDWFFAADKDTANSYYPYGVMQELSKKYPNDKSYNPEKLKNKGNLYQMYLNLKNPLIIDISDYDYASHRENADAWVEFTKEAEANGNDGIILYNAMDNQLKTSARESTVYLFRDSNQAKLVDNLNPTSNDDIRYAYRGTNKFGVEVYETSEETKKLSQKERVKKYVSLIENDFSNRTARFKRNGHIYYARFDVENASKIPYGENGMSKKGRKSIIKAGADGDIFDIVENSKYIRSNSDTKNHKLKDGFTDYFDYFYKTVQIDNSVFDIIINVKKSYAEKGGYTYTIKVFDNKKIKASPAEVDKQPLTVQDTPYVNNISQSNTKSQEGNIVNHQSRASMIEERINSLIEDSGAGSRKDYAQSWITSINPTDFLNLTLGKNNQDRNVFDTIPGDYGKNVNEYDYIEGLKKEKRQTPFLMIDINTGEVIGHEGRHRMRALEKQGITSAEIKVQFYDEGSLVKEKNGYGNPLETIKSIVVYNQRGTGQSATLNNIIPLNLDHKEEIYSAYGENNSENAIVYQSREFAKEIQKEFNTSESVDTIVSTIESMRDIFFSDEYDYQEKKDLIKYSAETLAYSALKKETVKDNEIVEYLENRFRSKRKNKLVNFEKNGIRLTAEQKAEIKGNYSSIREYQSKLLKHGIVLNEKGETLNDVWGELNEDYPSIFKSDTSDVDMPYIFEQALNPERSRSEEEFQYAVDSFVERLTSWVEDNPPEVPSFGEFRVDYSDPNLSQRDILATALMNAAADEGDFKIIQKYQENISDANRYERKLQKNKERLRDSFKKKKGLTAEERKALVEENKKLNEKIRRIDSQLLKLSSTSSLKGYVENERKLAEKKSNERSMAKTKLKQEIIRTSKWITYPTKSQTPCPDFLKEPISKVLRALGEGANNKDLAIALGNLNLKIESMKEAQDGEDGFNGYLDLPIDFTKELSSLAKQVADMSEYSADKAKAIKDLTPNQAQKFELAIKQLRHSAENVNKLHQNKVFESAIKAGESTVKFLDDIALKVSDKDSTSYKILMNMKDKAGKFLAWENALPEYVFNRFGEGGKSIFEEFKDSQDELARKTKIILDFTESVDGWNAKNIKKWETEKHEVELENGNKLTLTTANIMSIFGLARREQGVQHLLGGGVHVVYGKNNGETSDSILTINDLQKINDILTDEQRDIVIKAQKFFQTTGKWGNEISQKRFLVDMNTEKTYFPIETSDTTRADKDPQKSQMDMFRLLNISATKPLTPGANNQLVIRSFFEVFANHTADMAKMSSFGMSLLDFMKWFNYSNKNTFVGSDQNTKIEVKGVRKSMNKAFGENKTAVNYCREFIRDINGRSGSTSITEGIWSKFVRNTKVASVAANLRVAFLQPTAYLRAVKILSPASLTKGLSGVKNLGTYMKLAEKYCPMAYWKSLGFYETDINRGLESMIKGEESAKDKVLEKAMLGAEYGDKITWAVLFKACCYEVSKNGLTIGSEENYKAAGKLMRDVIYQTQVVDSTLTRSQAMRSKSTAMKVITAFMSEPTLSYNILLDSYEKLNIDSRKYGKKEAWNRNKKYVSRSLVTYAITAIAAAIVEGLFDSWRDDDDEKFFEKFPQNFLENLIGDVSVLNKIPIFKDGFSLAMKMFGIGYYKESGLDNQVLADINNAYEIIKDDGYTFYGKWVKPITRILSDLSGVPAFAALREVVSVWNNIAPAIWGDTAKIISYNRNTTSMAKVYLDALESGKNIDRALEQFEDNEKVQSGDKTVEEVANTYLKAYIGTQYKEVNMSKDKATEYLEKYLGMSDNDIYWAFDRWDSDSETYSKYEDLIEAVESGNVSSVVSKYVDNTTLKEGETQSDKKKRVLTAMRQSITSEYKNKYKNMSNAERVKIQRKLIDAYVACGMTRQEALEKINDWTK